VLCIFESLLLGWAGCYACPALRPYQFGTMSIPKYKHKVTVNGCEAVDGCEALAKWLAIDSCEAEIGV